MRIIISHVNLDFDGLASLFAAHKLYPDATVVMTDKINPAVKQFLTIYRDQLAFKLDHLIPWSEVTEMIVVDVSSLGRLGEGAAKLDLQHVKVILYDHHPPEPGDIVATYSQIEMMGATVTMLLEKIHAEGVAISPFEATLFGLGIYTDTGSFTYSNTTSRDLEMAAWLLRQGMNLELVKQFEEASGERDQRALLKQLILHSEEHDIAGVTVVVASFAQDKFQGGLSTQTHKLMEMSEADAAIVIAQMQKRVYVICRAQSKRIQFLPVLSQIGGGGHAQAASATIKNGQLKSIEQFIREQLPNMITKATVARDIMSHPVRTIPSDTTIKVAEQMFIQHGHSGFPVVENSQVIGMFTRRDMEKTKHGGYSHAPVKAYMSNRMIYVASDTPSEELIRLMIKHDIGRLPVQQDEEIIGIVTRTDLIHLLHHNNNML